MNTNDKSSGLFDLSYFMKNNDSTDQDNNLFAVNNPVQPVGPSFNFSPYVSGNGFLPSPLPPYPNMGMHPANGPFTPPAPSPFSGQFPQPNCYNPAVQMASSQIPVQPVKNCNPIANFNNGPHEPTNTTSCDAANTPISPAQATNANNTQKSDSASDIRHGEILPKPSSTDEGPACLTPKQQSVVKKGAKATAYDIMCDLVSNVHMFTHQQKIYIYDEATGSYKYTSQYEVEQLIMDRYRDNVKASGSGMLIERVYKLLLKEPQIVRSETPLSDPTKISFTNCTVDLQTQAINLHSPANIVTFALNSDLPKLQSSSEDCPVFDRFLHDISGGDPLLEKRIWEIFGYCLTPDTTAKVFFLLQGVPNSGKTLLCNLLRDFFPDDKFSALSVHSLREQFSAGNLEGKSLCISPDLPASALDSKSASIIKQVTGNDMVSAPVKNQRNAQFLFEGKLILASNYPLLTKEPDDAFMQRIVVVPFLHSIPREEQDRNLLERLKAEKPAIASKALEAYYDLRKNHYKFSGEFTINSSLLYPDELPESTGIVPLVYNFLLDNFEKDPSGTVPIEYAYGLFIQNVSDRYTQKMFSTTFQRLSAELFGATKTRSYLSGRYQNARSSIAGIRLK